MFDAYQFIMETLEGNSNFRWKLFGALAWFFHSHSFSHNHSYHLWRKTVNADDVYELSVEKKAKLN